MYFSSSFHRLLIHVLCSSHIDIKSLFFSLKDSFILYKPSLILNAVNYALCRDVVDLETVIQSEVRKREANII